MMSDARVKCVPSTMIIGVGCGNSYSISNPTRIFIRNTLPVASKKLATKAVECKAGGLVRSTACGQIRARSQKAMANCRESAHGAGCPNILVSRRAEMPVDRYDDALAPGNGSLQASFPDQGYRSSAAARRL